MTWEPRPYTGLGWLKCAIFAAQRAALSLTEIGTFSREPTAGFKAHGTVGAEWYGEATPSTCLGTFSQSLGTFAAYPGTFQRCLFRSAFSKVPEYFLELPGQFRSHTRAPDLRGRGKTLNTSRFVSQNMNYFQKVNSPTKSSTSCSLLLIEILSWRFCGGVDFK